MRLRCAVLDRSELDRVTERGDSDGVGCCGGMFSINRMLIGELLVLKLTSRMQASLVEVCLSVCA